MGSRSTSPRRSSSSLLRRCSPARMADRGISTRLRLLDQLATDKRRLVGAHLPFPGTGFVERKDGTYGFVPV